VQFSIKFDMPAYPVRISHHESIMMIGSCFTENICNKMAGLKYKLCQNPHGIIFNPVSVASCLRDIARNQVYTTNNLFELHEGWHSWQHHTRFSDPVPAVALHKMNAAMQSAHKFATSAQWLVVTLGSAFAYRHNELDIHVSNNHRAPHQLFTKELLDIEFIIAQLLQGIAHIRTLNPTLKIIFTISPVRHLRDGVIDNNRSKARLIESVYKICQHEAECFYFPSYEIVVDELRDYRFYDIDMAHPNYMATDYVWQRFKEALLAPEDLPLLESLHQIRLAMQHKPFNVNSSAHLAFKQATLLKIKEVQALAPHIDISQELQQFAHPSC
jgi:hypothetical protein